MNIEQVPDEVNPSKVCWPQCPHTSHTYLNLTTEQLDIKSLMCISFKDYPKIDIEIHVLYDTSKSTVKTFQIFTLTD